MPSEHVEPGFGEHAVQMGSDSTMGGLQRQCRCARSWLSVGVIVAVYLAGQLLYRLRDVVLLVVVGSFVALVLNPVVVALQRWKIRRRGPPSPS